ncbi:hypothetical protein [Magnetovibrio sp.]|uniref:hypothetical protein n=1 Tax=Magnetovibrio sp. TaxID=2024836 RepID=UPI002F93C8CD
MADITNVSTPVVRPAVQRASVDAARPVAAPGAAPAAAKGYGDAGEVSRRANVLNNVETPQNQASLNRLDRILSSGQPLRGDVPRGFYLDLKV